MTNIGKLPLAQTGKIKTNKQKMLTWLFAVYKNNSIIIVFCNYKGITKFLKVKHATRLAKNTIAKLCTASDISTIAEVLLYSVT